MRRLQVVGAATMAMVFMAALLWVMAPAPPVAGQSAGVTNFDSVTLNDDLIVGDDGTFGGNVSVAGTIAAAEFVTAAGDVTLPGSVTVSDTLTVGVDGTFGGNVQIDGTLAVSSTSVLTGNTQIRGTTDMLGNVADSGGVWTLADNALIDGAADVVQLTVQGHSTQTSNPNLLVVENSAGVDQFTVNATGNAATTADLTVGDDLVVTDDASANDLTVADFAGITAQGVITLTNGATLTPTGSLQPLTAAAAAGISGTSIIHVSDLLMLVNIGAQTITITETTGLISAGNIALGAGDASTLVWANGGWIEIARSNN